MTPLDPKIDIEIDGRRIEVLRTPYIAQKRKEWLCLVFSAEMCLGYFTQFYPDEAVRERTVTLTAQEIIDLTNTRVETGTTLSESTFRRFNERVRGVEFRQMLDSDVDQLAKRLTDNLPSIIIYNGAYYDTAEVGPAHAGVLVGTLDGDPIFNNPWFGMHKRMDRTRLERSWEMELNRAVLITPTPVQQKLEEAHA